MKVQCPSCAAVVPSEGVNLGSGWAKCAACDEVFPLADVLPGFSPAAGAGTEPVERPYNARAIVERSRQQLTMHVPAEGMRAGTWGLLGFATFWLAFIAFWTAGALGLFAGQWPPPMWNVIFASFSSLFWVVGFGMLGSVIWSSCGTRMVRFDAVSHELETQKRCLFWSRTKRTQLDRVQRGRPCTGVTGTYNTSGPSYGVEIIYEKGSFTLPTDSPDEQQWLTQEINDFLESIR